MKFIIVPMGSAGDVQPLTWLGRLLAARGHDVVLVVQSIVDEIAQRSGLRYVTFGDKAAQESIIKHPDLWHPRKAFPLIAGATGDAARTMIPAIETEARAPAATAIIAGSLAFGARFVGEKKHLPVLTVDLQPSLMMSLDDTPVMLAHGEWLPRAPRWLKRVFFSIARWQVRRHFGGPLGILRRELGLPSQWPGDIWHSPDGTLCLFPEWFATKGRDWPANAITTRFPLYDEAAVVAEDAALETFINAGEAPLLFTPGSANAQAAHFLAQGVAAAIRMNRRAILATRFLEQVPPNLPEPIRAFQYIPFSRIFPRCAAVIHHGGIGTTAQCLAAGVPQLIMPMAHDQPDNANRIKRFGVGEYLYPKKFVTEQIAPRLEALLHSPTVKAACAKYRDKVAEQMSELEMAALTEEMVEKSLHRRPADVHA